MQHSPPRKPVRAPVVATGGATRFAPAPHVTSAVHGAATALLDMRTERYYTLGEVGSRIWALLASGRSVDDIARRLGEEFDASEATIDADLRALLARLEGAALIRRVRDDRESRGSVS